MGAGGLAGGAERQSYKVVAPGWQERAVEKHLREAIIPHTANVHGVGSRRDPPCPCSAMLVIEGSTRRYGANASRRRCVPRDRRRRLHRRDRSINRLETPTAGCIRFGGIDVTACRAASRGALAMIFQQFNLVGRLDVPTHVLMGRLNHTPTLRAVLQLWSDEDKAFTFSALEQFDIASLAAQVDSLVAHRGSIRLFGRVA